MTRRWMVLFAAVLAAALALTAWSRMPRDRSDAPAAAAPAPQAELVLELRDGRVTPEIATVPKQYRVRVTVRNADMQPHRFELGGYAQALPPRTLPPGESWSGEFDADLPGEDFPWLVDGEPAGRLRVAGSHLEEGHR